MLWTASGIPVAAAPRAGRLDLGSRRDRVAVARVAAEEAGQQHAVDLAGPGERRADVLERADVALAAAREVDRVARGAADGSSAAQHGSRRRGELVDGQPGPLEEPGRERAVPAAVGHHGHPRPAPAGARSRASATSTSSRGVRTRWMPAAAQAAAIVSSPLASAPVCDRAARATAAPGSAASSTTGLPAARAAAAAGSSARPSPKSSR